MTTTETAPVEETKATKTQRVTFDGDIITFVFPGGKKVTTERSKLPQASRDHAEEYGIRRVLQDGLSGAIRDGEEADGAAERLWTQLTTGDWTRTRNASGKPTLDAFTKQQVLIAFKSAGKEAKGDAIKEAVGKLSTSAKEKIAALYKSTYETALDLGID